MTPRSQSACINTALKIPNLKRAAEGIEADREPLPSPPRLSALIAAEVLWGPHYLPCRGDHFALTEGAMGGFGD